MDYDADHGAPVLRANDEINKTGHGDFPIACVLIGGRYKI